MSRNNPDFIPARESNWFIAIFDLYVRLLFWRRFKNIRLHQAYQPALESRTIYYLNHTSWWDGLIPFLLNQKIFKQSARAMMEDKQMVKHSFFSKIGAFSVNLNTPRSSVKSLRYAVKSMNRENASLFIYPEGKIVPFSTVKPEFKKGLGWLSKQCPDADIVPIGIYIHTVYSDKPELAIHIGEPAKADRSLPPDTLNNIFETELASVLTSLVELVHSDPDKPERI